MASDVSKKTQAELDQEQRDRELRENNKRTNLPTNGLGAFNLNGSNGIMGILSAFIAMLTVGLGNMFSGMGSGYNNFTDALSGRGDTPLAPKGTKQNLGLANTAGTTLRAGWDGVLDLIGQHESGGDYNRVYGKGVKRADLTNMTIDQVQDWQKKYVNSGSASSAAGKYQIIQKTLTGLKQQMGLTGKEKFDEAMQDRMAMQLLENRGISQFAAGKMTTGQILNAISKEWASIENTSGKSAYDGDGLNKAAAGSGKQMVAALQVAVKADDAGRSSVARKIDTEAVASKDPVYTKAPKALSATAEMARVASVGQNAQNNDPVADRKFVNVANGAPMFVGSYGAGDTAKTPIASVAPGVDMTRVWVPNSKA